MDRSVYSVCLKESSIFFIVLFYSGWSEAGNASSTEDCCGQWGGGEYRQWAETFCDCSGSSILSLDLAGLAVVGEERTHHSL